MKNIPILFLLLLVSTPAFAFSQKFLDEATQTQKALVMDGEDFDEDSLKKCWDNFDVEVVALLNETKVLDWKTLNQQYAWKDILGKRPDGKDLKLGAVEIQFYPLKNETILASYYFGYGVTPASTVRVFKKTGLLWTSYEKMYSFEEDETIPDQKKLQWASVEIAIDKNGNVSTTHLPLTPAGGKPNRTKIDWHWSGDKLKGLRYNPTMDWHKKEGKIVSGPGQAMVLH